MKCGHVQSTVFPMAISFSFQILIISLYRVHWQCGSCSTFNCNGRPGIIATSSQRVGLYAHRQKRHWFLGKTVEQLPAWYLLTAPPRVARFNLVDHCYSTANGTVSAKKKKSYTNGSRGCKVVTELGNIHAHESTPTYIRNDTKKRSRMRK
ncbi:hypothetical protein SCLCIDRAFT_154711 [Scleroderma citrinum Foug A]|uniref:Uncharacterized protein n=1 Tax=Scleroderma citrinum Foug A TaxID=1036808 RepID=A0A0C3EQY6_9AGAM|nr:hypothetical protein SCLCIDRAFT_154711 [Scleroderma citrinum Foug A]